MPKSLSLKETASYLEISTATVVNWERHGYLKSRKESQKAAYDYNEVLSLKNKIDRGQLERLAARANKKNSQRTFLPKEYFEHEPDEILFNQIVGFILNKKLNTEKAMFVLCLAKLIQEELLAKLPLNELLKFYNKNTPNNNLREELNKWQLELGSFSETGLYDQLLLMELPRNGDILGVIYQSVLTEGDKSKKGSYFTPKYISDEIAKAHLNQIKGAAKILDPCCGTGQFLLSASDIIKKHGRLIKPASIWGYDIDGLAVKIARINLMVKFRDFDFAPNIYQRNVIYNYSYDDKSRRYRNFDLIIGNPPWGAEFKIEQSTFLSEKFPEILSSESYSYFILIALNMLRPGGFLSFILPESILNIKTHMDIRNHVLLNAQIRQIKDYGRVFKNVYTPVIRMDLKKSPETYDTVKIKTSGNEYKIKPSRFFHNPEKIFDIYLNAEEEQILKKLHKREHTTLKNQADWALGIVTGNNTRFLSPKKKKGFEAVIKGTDVQKYFIRQAQNFIYFKPELLQQTAPTNKYRAKEKLFYKFISKKLIFAYDDQKRLSLNSANILIPKIKDYPVKVVMAFFNSSLYQFMFRKKFFTHKILRGQLEQLPLPLLTDTEKQEILKLTGQLMLSAINEKLYNIRFGEMDQFIYQIFGITTEEQKLINKALEA